VSDYSTAGFLTLRDLWDREADEARPVTLPRLPDGYALGVHLELATLCLAHVLADERGVR